MRLTLPQVFMLNHAATVNSRRMDESIERDKQAKERATQREQELDAKDPVVPGTGGKRLSQCNSEEIAGQFSQW